MGTSHSTTAQVSPEHLASEGDAWRESIYGDHDPPLRDPDDVPLAAVRSEFGARTTSVFGWPSTGGLWVHSECYAVELDFLGLPRFESAATARFSPEEDAFCERLERIGATFFETELAYNRQQLSYPKYEIWYGWPRAMPEKVFGRSEQISCRVLIWACRVFGTR